MQDTQVVGKLWVQDSFVPGMATQVVIVYEDVPPRKPRRK